MVGRLSSSYRSSAAMTEVVGGRPGSSWRSAALVAGVSTSGRAPERLRLTATAGNTMTEHARADECGSVLRQHRSRLKTDCGQRDEQRQGGRRQQHQLDPTAHRQVTPIEQQGGKAADR